MICPDTGRHYEQTKLTKYVLNTFVVYTGKRKLRKKEGKNGENLFCQVNAVYILAA
jgi:hypothetical protein